MIDIDKLNSIFENLDKDIPVGILIHPAPDPDCMGAAVGFSVLLKEVYELKTKIFHFGEISHAMNRSLRNILHIPLTDGKDFDSDQISVTVVLDTDLEGTGFKLDKVDVRIDHHAMDRDSEVKYLDVRINGATCSIVWEYLKELGVSLDEYPDEATAMVLGITTDTLNFTSANTTELDMEAFRSLLPFVNKNALARVTKYKIPKIAFDIEQRAFKDKEIRNTALVSFVGEIIPHNRDIIATIADRFARMDGINTAIIIGVIDNHIVASIRSEDPTVDVNDMCVKVFGKLNGGGKEGSGGAKFPLGEAFELIEDKAIMSQAKLEVIKQFRENLFNYMGEHKEDE